MTSPESFTRAGRYQAQPSGYQAFVPAPLPPDPPVELSGDLQAFLSEADRGLGRLDGAGRALFAALQHRAFRRDL